MSNTTMLPAARAAALFVSTVSAGTPLDREAADRVIRAEVRSRGTRGCVARVARVYGDNPMTAPGRMRWAISTVAGLYPPRHCPGGRP